MSEFFVGGGSWGGVWEFKGLEIRFEREREKVPAGRVEGRKEGGLGDVGWCFYSFERRSIRWFTLRASWITHFSGCLLATFEFHLSLSLTHLPCIM